MEVGGFVSTNIKRNSGNLCKRSTEGGAQGKGVRGGCGNGRGKSVFGVKNGVHKGGEAPHRDEGKKRHTGGGCCLA